MKADGWFSRVSGICTARFPLVGELFRFGVVGVAGFVVDAAVLELGLRLGTGPWVGRVFSYLAGATTTFHLNRAWTFRSADRSRPMAQEWSFSPREPGRLCMQLRHLRRADRWCSAGP